MRKRRERFFLGVLRSKKWRLLFPGRGREQGECLVNRFIFILHDICISNGAMYVCMYAVVSRKKRHSIFYLYVSLWIALYISMYPLPATGNFFVSFFTKIQIFCSHRQIFSQIYQGKVTKTGSQQILITFLGINQSTASFRLSLNLIFY
jgi:hypothetical protein